jgi:hypothetical protein
MISSLCDVSEILCEVRKRLLVVYRARHGTADDPPVTKGKADVEEILAGSAEGQDGGCVISEHFRVMYIHTYTLAEAFEIREVENNLDPEFGGKSTRLVPL